MNGLFKVMPQHLNRIQVRTLTWAIQRWTCWCVWVIVLLHNPSALELEVTNWRPDILLQGFDRVQNSCFHQLWKVVQVLKLRPAHYHHHVWLLIWCVGFYARCNGTRTFQKVQLLSHQSTEYEMSHDCALGVILVGRQLLGRISTVTSFLHLWLMALT